MLPHTPVAALAVPTLIGLLPSGATTFIPLIGAVDQDGDQEEDEEEPT